MGDTMRAWAVSTPGPVDSGPLVAIEREIPAPTRGQIRLRVVACGVCRTDLHLVEGDLPPRRPLVIPGHEIVGVVDALGPETTRHSVGDRVGAAWLAHTCGECRFCLADKENLCLYPTFTGWDIDGGYAQYVVVNEDYVYALPVQFNDVDVAPLLCAASLAIAPCARALFPKRGASASTVLEDLRISRPKSPWPKARACTCAPARPRRVKLARSLGVISVGDTDDPLPEPLDASILFAPVGTIVPTALASLDRGGTLAIAASTSPIFLPSITRSTFSRRETFAASRQILERMVVTSWRQPR